MRRIIAIALGRRGHLVCPWASLKERPARTFPTAPTWSAPAASILGMVPDHTRPKGGEVMAFSEVDLLAWLRGKEQID